MDQGLEVLTALRSSDEDICFGLETERALKNLTRSEADGILPTLLAMLSCATRMSREVAGWALGYLSGVTDARLVVTALITALEDEIPSVRSNAAEALGNFGPIKARDSIPKLLYWLKRLRIGDLSQIISALGKMGMEAKDAFHDLVQLSLGDWKTHHIVDAGDILDSIDISNVSREALNEIAPEEAVRAFELRLYDKDENIQIEAVSSLAAMSKAAEQASSALRKAAEIAQGPLRKIIEAHLTPFDPMSRWKRLISPESLN